MPTYLSVPTRDPYAFLPPGPRSVVENLLGYLGGGGPGEPGSYDRGRQSPMAVADDIGGGGPNAQGGMAAQGMYGLSPEDLAQLQQRVGQYRTSRFGGGPLSQLPPGTAPSPMQVLGPDLYNRLL